MQNIKFIIICSIFYTTLNASIILTLYKDVNIKKEPSINSKTIKKIDFFQKVEIIKVVDKIKYTWLQLKDGGYVRSVDSNYHRYQKYLRPPIRKEIIVKETYPVKDFNEDFTKKSLIMSIIRNANRYTSNEDRGKGIKNKNQKKLDDTLKNTPTEKDKQFLRTKENTEQNNTAKINKKNFFVGFNIGNSTLDASSKNVAGNFTGINEPDNNGNKLDIEVGYLFGKNWFSSLRYEQVKFDDTTLYNYLLTYTYKFNIKFFQPYVGILTGVSLIDLEDPIIDGLTDIDLKGASIAYGLHMGGVVPIVNNISMNVNYEIMQAKHKTNLIGNSINAELLRENLRSLNFGLRYDF